MHSSTTVNVTSSSACSMFQLHFPPTHYEEESLRQYRCPHPGCTQRRMDYRGWSLHMAIAHKVLGDIMARDPTPGMREVLALLYPDREKIVSTSPADTVAVSSTSNSAREELA